MTDTPNLGLPLIAASQAQKHVTVNEALVRLDAFSRLVLASRSLGTPPEVVAEGTAYFLPPGAVNAWSGQDGAIAIGVNGGWIFQQPRRGWSAWIEDEATEAIFDGVGWRAGALALSPGGAGLSVRLVESDHVLGAGSDATTGLILPARGIVLGVTGRVIEAITGSLTGWSVGVTGAVDRYANGVGLAAGSQFTGPSGTPMTYWSDTAVVLTAEGGSFATGTLRLAAQVIELAPPDTTP